MENGFFMCIVLVLAGLLLVFYGSERLQDAVLSVRSGQATMAIAQDWDILWALWPFLAAAFMVGVTFVMLVLKFTKSKI